MGVCQRARRGWSPAAIAITLALGGSASAFAEPDDAPAAAVAQLSAASSAPRSAAAERPGRATPPAAERVGATGSAARLDARAVAALLAGYRAQVAAAPLTCNLQVSLLAAVVAARPSAAGGSTTATVARQLCAGARDLSDLQDLRAGLWAVDPSPSFAGLVATYQSRYVRLGLDRDLTVTDLQSQDLVGGSLTATALLPAAGSASAAADLGAAAERAADRAFREGARQGPRSSAQTSPSGSTSEKPAAQPSEASTPSGSPTEPSGSPATDPTGKPAGSPSGTPSGTPSGSPSGSPSGIPSVSPSGSPSVSPSGSPSGTPTGSPSPTASAPSAPGDVVECTPPTHGPTGDAEAACPPCVPGAGSEATDPDPSGTGPTGNAASREQGTVCVPAGGTATAPSPSSGQ